jgi:NAD(P)-dependent dehydrogenase (short-subunit alcohol dehydrogenase family)
MVTGAARGLGRAMALGLAQSGAQVAALDMPASRAELTDLLRTAQREGVRGSIHPVDCDVTRWEDCVAAVAQVVARFGAVHGLVNNAAIGMQDIGHVLVGARKRFDEVEAETWRRSIDVNLNGPFMMAKAVMPGLLAQGWGRVVNIVTSTFTMHMQGFSPYGPSKAALEAATVVWAKDLADTGVTVNALLPGGPANTRMIPADEVTDRSTLIQPDVLIAPIRWLMSRQSDGVSGRRIVAKDWDPALDPAAAAARASGAAGW